MSSRCMVYIAYGSQTFYLMSKDIKLDEIGDDTQKFLTKNLTNYWIIFHEEGKVV